MTVTYYRDLEQNTDEWLELRRGILTASTIGQLITPKTVKVASNAESRALTYRLLAERITGHVERGYVSWEMEMGHVIEPIVRDLYSEHYGPVAVCGFVERVTDSGARVGWSPDGLVNEDGGIETKSRDPHIQMKTILEDAVPAENIAQLQAALWVSGRKWIDYLSFCGGMPLYITRVHPDPRWQDAITEVVDVFETTATELADRYAERTEGLVMTERVEYNPVELKL